MLNAKRLTTNAEQTMNKTNYFRFEKLEVWRDAREFVSLVYEVTSTFPSKEQLGLINQIRRAAVSIVLNIAEGSTKGSDIDFRRYLKIAQGSVNEVVAGFYIALDQKFIDEKHFEQIYDFSLKINSKLNAFMKALVVKHSALSN